MLVKLSDRKEMVYGVSTEYALSTIDEKDHPELYVHLEDDEAETLFWEILKKDLSKYDEYLRKIKTRPVGSYTVVNTLNKLAMDGKLPYKSISIVDGDKRTECPSCLRTPNKTEKRSKRQQG